MAGYSGTPLSKKLGLRAGSRLLVRGAPERFGRLLEPLPDGVRMLRRRVPAIDVAIAFGTRRASISKHVTELAPLLADGGSIWLAWPKKSSGMATELDFDTVRRIGLESGLVDTKVCAVDDVWSGLRFMRRRARR